MFKPVSFFVYPHNNVDVEKLKEDLEKFAPALELSVRDMGTRKRKRIYISGKTTKEVFEDLFSAELIWETARPVLPPSSDCDKWRIITYPEIPEIFKDRIRSVEVSIPASLM